MLSPRLHVVLSLGQTEILQIDSSFWFCTQCHKWNPNINQSTKCTLRKITTTFLLQHFCTQTLCVCNFMRQMIRRQKRTTKSISMVLFKCKCKLPQKLNEKHVWKRDFRIRH